MFFNLALVPQLTPSISSFAEPQTAPQSPPDAEPQSSPDAPIVPVQPQHTRATPITKQCPCHRWVRTIYTDHPTKATCIFDIINVFTVSRHTFI